MSRRRSVLGSVAVAAVVLTIGATTMNALGGTPSVTDLSAAAATAGCGRAPTLASGTHTIQSSGKNRSFVLRVPDNYNNNNQYRLVFGFHWLNGSATNVVNDQYYGLLPLANNSTIFVAPQGLNAGWANSGGEDVTFTDDMIRRIGDALCVDNSQIFSTGFSYGGGMSFSLACSRASVIRAVAVIAGGQISGCAGGNDRIAYLGIHGINDSVLNISGGRTLRDRFVRNNGCAAQNPAEPASGSRTHIVTAYSGCAAGYPVVWAAFDGGHEYQPRDGGSGSSWVPALTWQFFTQFQSTTPPTTAPTTRPTTAPTTRVTTPPTSRATTPTGSGPTGTGTCRVAVTVNAWNTGLTEGITITNTGSSAVNGWSLVFTLPSGQSITSGWNATYTPPSGQVTARNVSYNPTIAPNASVSIGFQATHTGNTGPPTSFALNGVPCTVA